MDALLLIPIALPVVGGAALLVSSFREGASVAGRQDSGTGGRPRGADAVFIWLLIFLSWT